MSEPIPMGAPPRISECIDDAARHWAQGLTAEEIGARLGFHRSTISKLARNNPDRFPVRKIKPGPDAKGDAHRQEASVLWKAGADSKSICQSVGIKLATLYAWASDNRDLFPRRETGVRSGRPKNGWQEHEHALLLKLAGEGLSASDIAMKIPGKTRNAVIGALHRMGRGKLLTKAKRAAPAKTMAGTAVSRQRDTGRPQPKEGRSSSDLFAGNFQLSGCEGLAGKALTDLDWNECRWPVNAPASEKTETGRFRLKAGEQHLFCGGAALPGKRYCAAHFPLSFTAAAAPTIARPFGARGKTKPGGVLARMT